MVPTQILIKKIDYKFGTQGPTLNCEMKLKESIV